MKKTLYILSTIFILFFIVSCTKKPVIQDPPEEEKDYSITSIVQTSDDISFDEGEFDPTSIILTVNKNNTEPISIKLSDATIESNIDNLIIGKNNIKAKYENFTFYVSVTINKKIINDNTFTYQLSSNQSSYILTGYEGNKEHIVLPLTYNNLPVVEIDVQAFLNNDVIKSVIIPSSYTTIGEAAFYKCVNLKSVYIPKTVTSVGPYALNNVNVVLLEDKAVNTSWDSKWYDEKETSIRYEVSADSIKRDEKYEYVVTDTVCITNYYGEETDILLPDTYNNKNITEIGGRAFANNQTLNSVVLPKNTLVISEYAFIGCSILTNVTLSNCLTLIGNFVFGRCELLNNVVLPETLEEIGTGAFNSCYGLETLTIPECVTTVGAQAFDWCTAMKTMYIHDTLVNVGENAFYACSKLHIYVEFATLPTTWHERCNPSNRPITYNYVFEIE